MPDPNTDAVRSAVAAAREISRSAAPPDPEPLEQSAWGGGGAALPDDCPVTPLGVTGDAYHYLDDLGQHRQLAAKEHSKLAMQSLFGRRPELLYQHWPRHSKEGDVTGWRAEKVSEVLMKSCSDIGVWDAFERLRGHGAWLGEDGELVLHCGDGVWQEGHGWRGCGAIGRFVYPGTSPKPRPFGLGVGDAAAQRASAAAATPAHAHGLLTMLKTWHWARPDIDPHLMLGWIGAAMVGGALKWRVLAWVTGDRGTGKSTLQDLLKHLFDGQLLSVADPTAAGIWQQIGNSSAPIAVDELEAEEDNKRAQAIIKLARLAASGAQMVRGGSDHNGVSFTVKSCFLFSSILRPPTLSSEVSRMALLDLLELQGTTPPKLEPGALRVLGQVLRRRLVEQWPRFAATIEAYRVALAAAGHGGRGADQFGTLLACADLLLHDGEGAPPADDVDLWAERLQATGLAERAEDVPDHERCIAHLVSSTLEAYRSGERPQVGTLIDTCAQPENWYFGPKGTWESAHDGVEANRLLGTIGVRVIKLEGFTALLAPTRVDVANSHRGLAAIYQSTHWAGRSGAAAVYCQALRRVPGAITTGTQKFNGVPSRATRLPLDQVLRDPDAITQG